MGRSSRLAIVYQLVGDLAGQLQQVLPQPRPSLDGCQQQVAQILPQAVYGAAPGLFRCCHDSILGPKQG
jgi:hypothetical protein